VAEDYFVLNEGDRTIFMDMLREYKARKQNPQQRPRQVLEDPMGPGVYVAYVSEEIAGLSNAGTTGTGSEITDDEPGSGECAIYRIYDDANGVRVEETGISSALS
jgi:hypothetical protein